MAYLAPDSIGGQAYLAPDEPPSSGSTVAEELIVTVATIMRASQTNLHGRMSAAAITMTVSF